MPKYTKEQFWKLYQNLPQELQDALFSGETGTNIYETCKRNEIEENLSQIVDYVGQVLMGLLPPEEFQEALETEVGLEKEVAKKVSFEINRYIFRPVKESLRLLYEEERPEKEELPEKEEKKPKKKDIYREPIE